MSQQQYFGHLGDIHDPPTFFQEQNYIICRDVIPEEKIDSLVDFYDREVVTSKKKYLRQSTSWERNDISPTGGVINGFLNPHTYERGDNSEFSDRVLKLLDSRKIQDTLSEISNRTGNFMLLQTMLFDKSITRPHQDWIYLDSNPNGHMIAAWIALEDIHADGIRFFVYPGTHNFTPEASYADSQARNEDFYQHFIEEIDELLATDQYEIYAPPLKKGDIFFWGSRLIHGSIAGENSSRRRRSVAAHFLPDGFKYGNLQEEFQVKSKTYSADLSYVFKGRMDAGFQQANSLVNRINGKSLYRRLKKKLSIAS